MLWGIGGGDGDGPLMGRGRGGEGGGGIILCVVLCLYSPLLIMYVCY